MNILDQNKQPFDNDGLQQHIDRALAVEEPTGVKQEISYQLIKRIFNPVLINADNIPDTPCLFIGNHSLFALDGMVLGPLMLHEQGRFLRGLGDKFLWTPLTEKGLLEQGAVLGHPEVCSALMENGSDLLVFPGGAHEATKTAAQKYTLLWKERYGFARLAAQHGYTVMPFAMLGPDEFYSHLIEGEDLPETTVGQLLKRLGVIDENTRADMLPPIPIGALGSMFPKPQRCYVQFGEAVDLVSYAGKRLTKKQLQSIRAQVAEQIEEMIAELLLL
ncbi:MAG: lysophospholipid acyltransferase family protein, partial [Pseudomonadales bacterium]